MKQILIFITFILLSACSHKSVRQDIQKRKIASLDFCASLSGEEYEECSNSLKHFISPCKLIPIFKSSCSDSKTSEELFPVGITYQNVLIECHDSYEDAAKKITQIDLCKYPQRGKCKLISGEDYANYSSLKKCGKTDFGILKEGTIVKCFDSFYKAVEAIEEIELCK